MSKNHAQDLRRILAENKFLTLPGVYDCLSGKIAEEAGFPALFLSGGALAYSVLGRPDFGFLSLAEFGTAIRTRTTDLAMPFRQPTPVPCMSSWEQLACRLMTRFSPPATPPETKSSIGI